MDSDLLMNSDASSVYVLAYVPVECTSLFHVRGMSVR